MRASLTQRLTLAALFAALTAVCAQIQIPLPMVPISLALFSVFLCGAVLGPRWGTLSMLAYILMGLIGVPVYAGFTSGPGILFGPTGGYIAGYLLCASIVGRLARRFGFSLRSLCLAMAAGTLACYVPGTLWFMLTTGTSLGESLALCVLPFIPGDAVKVLLAAVLARRMQQPMRAMGLTS